MAEEEDNEEVGGEEEEEEMDEKEEEKEATKGSVAKHTADMNKRSVVVLEKRRLHFIMLIQ